MEKTLDEIVLVHTYLAETDEGEKYVTTKVFRWEVETDKADRLIASINTSEHVIEGGQMKNV